MPVKTLTIIESTPTTQGTFFINSVLSNWTAEQRPETQTTLLDKVLDHPTIVQNTGVAWIIIDQFDSGNFAGALAIFQEKDIPVMLTRTHEIADPGDLYQQGIVLGPFDAPPASLTAVLRTLWCQHMLIDHLKAEIRYLQVHEGGLADQMGKIDEELRLAAQLQQEFLPTTLPQLPDVNFQVLFRPASYVSGDIYDITKLDEHHVGIFLADAVGHGMPAALMTMYIKRSLKTKEFSADEPNGYRIIPPNEALSLLNYDLCNQPTEKINFATACYGILDCRTFRLTIARAGHPYPLVIRQDASHHWLKPEGAMLGIFEDEVYQTIQFDLKQGDRLIIYSDGFELAFPEDEAVTSEDDLVHHDYADEFIKLNKNCPMSKFIDRLARHLDTQVGSLHQRDDLTALFIGLPETDEDIIDHQKAIKHALQAQDVN